MEYALCGEPTRSMHEIRIPSLSFPLGDPLHRPQCRVSLETTHNTWGGSSWQPSIGPRPNPPIPDRKSGANPSWHRTRRNMPHATSVRERTRL